MFGPENTRTIDLRARYASWLAQAGFGDEALAEFTLVHQTLERTTEWKWPSQSRFLLGPSSQFVGNGEDRITLTGVILPEWRGGTGQIDRFREMGGMGQSYLLVGGLGRIFLSKAIFTSGLEGKSGLASTTMSALLPVRRCEMAMQPLLKQCQQLWQILQKSL